ncbi:MAG: S8 family peptidase [Dehalococcoidia bacterium]|nr:S8 family peptidase [Dehalococcoidia bacterium]
MRKIVVFRAGVPGGAVGAALERHGGAQIDALPLIGGAVVQLPNEAAARALAGEADVVSVEDDIVIDALVKPTRIVPPAQIIPWGVERIAAPSAWATTTGDPVKVGIIDTGIDTAHPELAANVKGGVSCVAYTRKYSDDNGHGTHVAGIVAAIDNTYGVVGVAPQADIYSIKVLDRRGSGYLSDIIEGLDWAVANGMDVVNMSLGTNLYSAAFELAVQRVDAAGVVQVAAAGNDGPGEDTVDYPAAFPEVIAVGATTEDDIIAWFSSCGPQVAVVAPGVNIYSTYKGSAYATLSGTSMASPHVTGTLALMLTQPVGDWDTDGDSTWDPGEVLAKLNATALDCGETGVDSVYGAGLVCADLAVAQ